MTSGSEYGELVAAIREFQRATARLTAIWESTAALDEHAGFLLGTSYGDLPSFDELAAIVAGWQIPDPPERGSMQAASDKGD